MTRKITLTEPKLRALMDWAHDSGNPRNKQYLSNEWLYKMRRNERLEKLK